MKYILISAGLLLAQALFAQPSSISYNNGQLLVNNKHIVAGMPKTEVDGAFNAASRTKYIIGTYDPVTATKNSDRKRAYFFNDEGLYYCRYIKDTSTFELHVAVGYEPRIFRNKDSLQTYEGTLMLGNQSITKFMTLDNILSNPSFRLIKETEVKTKKQHYRHAILTFQDVLVKLFMNADSKMIRAVNITK